MKPDNTSMTAAIASTVTRLLLPAWIGGALLYVVTSVAEQRFPQFDSRVRDQLATIRFPWYYLFCWLTLGTATCAACIAALLHHHPLRKRATLVAALTVTSLGIATADYVFIYKPLLQLITPPGQLRTPEFTRLHNRSRIVNEIHLTLALAAAVTAGLPQSRQLQTVPESNM
jgi:hypothetical protein